MRTAIVIVTAFALATISGCKTTSPRGGGMTKDAGFKIVVPTLDTTIQQGDVRAATVSLQRGEYFKEDVRLQITASDGISVGPTDILIKASESPDVQVRIATTKNTALGAYIVSVTGMPKTGEPTSTAFTVKVVAP